MFRGSNQLDQVVSLLEERDVCLWHACQLREFNAYMDLGGIASRSLLEQAGVDFTRRPSDAADRAHRVWDKVFVNLNDIGAVFAHGGEASPNVYGPIVLQVRPAALRRAEDVAVTLQSSGSANYDRSAESLATIEDLRRVFLHPATAPFPHRR